MLRFLLASLVSPYLVGFYTVVGAWIRVPHIGELLLLSIYRIACVTTLYPRGGVAVCAVRGDCVLTRAEAALTVSYSN